MKKILLSLTFLSLLWIPHSWGQTTLTAGDIMMVTVNADGDKNFDFVPLVDLSANTIIFFTDNAWNGTQLLTNEGILKYTSSSPVNAGTVISYSGIIEEDWSTEEAGYNLSGSGDNLLVFQGSTASPSFILGVGFAISTPWITSGVPSTNNSYKPATLNEGANTIISLGTADNYRYNTTNGTSGTTAELLALSADGTKFENNSSTAYSALSTNFIVSNSFNTSVQYSTASASVSEGDGTYDLSLTISNPDAEVPTTCQVSMSTGTGSNPTALDIGNYTTQDVTFPANSSEIQTVTISLTDDIIFEGTETFSFSIINITGGNSAVVGVQNTFELTIEDNDLKPEPSNHVDNISVGSITSNSMTLNWDIITGGTDADGYYLFINTVEDNLPSPIDETEISEDIDFSDGNGAVLVNNNIETYTWIGLRPETNYYFEIYPYTNSGSFIDYKTDGTIPNTSSTTNVATAIPNLVITEIMQNPNAVSDSNGEWFEIYNSGSTTININGFIIKDNGSNSHTINNGGALDIDAGSYLVLGNNDGSEDSNGGVTIDYKYSSFSLRNTDDEIILYLSDGITEIDKVEYDGGSNWPNPTGKSMSLNPNKLTDNNNGSYWFESITQYGAGDLGTPGATNDIIVTTWNGSTNNDWNDSNNWSGDIPTNNANTIIPSSGINNFPTITTSASVQNLTIESDATLLGAENLTINGSATVKRSLEVSTWQYLTPPVSGATANDIEVSTEEKLTYILEYNNNVTGSGTESQEDMQKGWTYLESEFDALTVGTGYAVQVPEAKEIQFSGTLATGDQTISGITSGDDGKNPWVFIGNSALAHLDWQAVATDNDITGLAYLYDPTFSGGSYVSINPDGVHVNGESKYIPPMQGFFVKVDAFDDGQISFPATALSHSDQDFYKSETIHRNFVRLAIQKGDYTDETVIYFKDNAINSYNSKTDGDKLMITGENTPQLYSLCGNHKLVINTLQEWPISIPLNVYSSQSGTLTMNAIEILNLDPSLDVYLEDKQTSTFQNLSEKNLYSFDATIGENENRFVLHYTNVALSIDEQNYSSNIYSIQNSVIVDRNTSKVALIEIYSLSGQLVHRSKLTSNKSKIETQLLSGIYLVLLLENQDQTIKKITINN